MRPRCRMKSRRVSVGGGLRVVRLWLRSFSERRRPLGCGALGWSMRVRQYGGVLCSRCCLHATSFTSDALKKRGPRRQCVRESFKSLERRQQKGPFILSRRVPPRARADSGASTVATAGGVWLFTSKGECGAPLLRACFCWRYQPQASLYFSDESLGKDRRD